MVRTISILLLWQFICLWQPIQAAETIKVACVGNSITYGTGIKNRDADSYPAQLQKLLGNQYIVGNFGKPGATLFAHGHRPYIQQEVYQKALHFAGDIVVIHLGVNDTDPRNWPNYRDEFVHDYLQLTDSFKKVNPQCRILLAYITPLADRHPRFLSGTRQWHEEIQEAIGVAGQISRAEMIDFHTPLYPYPILLPDAIHPNEEGAGILARTVYAAITGYYGGLQLPDIYTDYMVLQRDTPLHIHGTADADTPVTVRIGGQEKNTVTGKNGKWEILLDPLKAGEDYVLSIQTPRQSRTFRHVAAGEVWLCSGQSNMQFMLKQCKDASSDVAQANHPAIRLFHMQGRWDTNATEWPTEAIDSVNHLQYYRTASWKECTPATAASFSAVAYYFGKMLQDSLKVPIGLICNAVGGSTTESWIDRHSLEQYFPAILKDWTHNDFVQEWARERALLNLRQSTSPFKRHPYEPCYLYEAGILPLQQYPVKGVIWYQGESNAHNMEAHQTLFKLLVEGWRKNWHNPEMPFYFVQLSSLNRPSWPWFRDSQRRLMQEIPCTGMAVSSDKGDSLDVHPKDKRPIGERLARWALNRTYHYTLLPSGPLYKRAVVTGDEAVLEFNYAEGLRTSDGKAPACFEVAEYEGMYFPAQATIEGNTVRVRAAQVKCPRYVRYGWQPFTRANLVNKDLLPASSFREEIGQTESNDKKTVIP